MAITLGTGTPSTAAQRIVNRLVSDRVASRVFARDASLWSDSAQVTNRLGWTDFEANARAAISDAERIRQELQASGVDRVVLCGMGGSSLAPEVIARWSGTPLTVIDSTHPGFLAAELASDLGRTLVVVSSKSGSTIETMSHRAAFAAAFERAGIDPAERILVITDPGSPLERSARDAGQRVCFADPDVGGRFSALTAFGLVPTALAGVDVRELLDQACAARELLMSDDPANPALRLAAEIAAGLPARFVLGIAEAPGSGWGLGSWIEQLVAESTGKYGHGVFPIALPHTAPEFVAPPANLIRVRLGASETAEVSEDRAELTVAASLGAQFLLWEVATAVLGHLLGIDPFDQPDVESAKVAARAVLDHPENADAAGKATPIAELSAVLVAAPPKSLRGSTADLPDTAAELLTALQAAVPPGGYLAVQAYLDPNGGSASALTALRDELARSLGVPVSLGWGPRYLHSVGQLHKGGPALGAFLQLIDTAAPDLAIPGADSGFGTLIAAQARGDRKVLSGRGRAVFALGSAEPATLISELIAAVASWEAAAL